MLKLATKRVSMVTHPSINGSASGRILQHKNSVMADLSYFERMIVGARIDGASITERKMHAGINLVDGFKRLF